jgi:hypothetical protein
MMPITRVPADKRTHDESSQEEAREGGGKWKGGEEGGKEGGKDKRRREGGGRLDGRSSTKEPPVTCSLSTLHACPLAATGLLTDCKRFELFH